MAERNTGTAEGETISSEIWSPRFSFSKLTNTNRVNTIMLHRSEVEGLNNYWKEMLGNVPHHGPTKEMNNEHDNVNPAGGTKIPKRFKALNPIKIREMNPEYCTYWVGYKIELELIEDADSVIRGMLMGQDKIGDVVRVALYNDEPFTEDPLFQEKLGFGTKITIANPYMKIALDGRTMIRLEDDDALFIHKEKDLKKCRFCSKPNCEKKCVRCKKAFYCSRECQTHDWKILKHKGLCDAYKWIASL